MMMMVTWALREHRGNRPGAELDGDSRDGYSAYRLGVAWRRPDG
jgi:hypothetical protein